MNAQIFGMNIVGTRFMNDLAQTKQHRADISLYSAYAGPHHFVLNVLSICLVFAFTLKIGPHMNTTASPVLPHKEVIPVTSWVQRIPDPIVSVPFDYDSQKSLDLWKHITKSVYTTKALTVPQYIWYYLTERMGLSDIAASGVFGNMMVECGNRSFTLRPYVYSPGNAYYGLCQWNTGGHHSSINGGTLDEQLEYLANTIESEMHTSNYQRLCNASTPEEAANIFGQWYERCLAPTSRQNEARRAYERFGS